METSKRKTKPGKLRDLKQCIIQSCFLEKYIVFKAAIDAHPSRFTLKATGEKSGVNFW